MMNFAHIEYLLGLLVLIPIVFIAIKFITWRKKSFIILHTKNTNQNNTLLIIKLVFITLSFIFLIVGIADPLLSIGEKKVTNEGIDIVVAMDISTSMLATDVSPNRLTRAKMLVSKIINQQDNNRLGLIFFAGKAYLQMPLSIDKDAAKMYVNGASPNLAPMQGTNIADAVKLSIEAFNKAEKKYKVLIIITDGEDHEGADDEAIAAARSSGIIVHTIGVGTETPTAIPLDNGSFKLDRNGQKVLTAINKNMISNLASKGGGKSFFISNMSDPVSNLLDEINNMDKKAYEEKTYTSNDHQFILCLSIAFIFLILYFIIPNDNSFFNKLKN